MVSEIEKIKAISRRIAVRKTAFTNLVVFLLDRSASMGEETSVDGKTKWEHLTWLVENLLERLHGSGTMASAFKAAFVWFNHEASIVEKDGRRVFPVYGEEGRNEALEVFRSTLDMYRPSGKTAIGDALEAALSVIEEYVEGGEDAGKPKYITVFLFSDGREVVRDNTYVLEKARRLKEYLSVMALGGEKGVESGSIATVALGEDADENLLREIAMEQKSNQRRALELAGVKDYVDEVKLFMPFPKQGYTREFIEAIRRFMEKVSETATQAE